MEIILSENKRTLKNRIQKKKIVSCKVEKKIWRWVLTHPCVWDRWHQIQAVASQYHEWSASQLPLQTGCEQCLQDKSTKITQNIIIHQQKPIKNCVLFSFINHQHSYSLSPKGNLFSGLLQDIFHHLLLE